MGTFRAGGVQGGPRGSTRAAMSPTSLEDSVWAPVFTSDRSEDMIDGAVERASSCSALGFG